MIERKVHPAANFWPMLAERELEMLASDIKCRGLQVPILLYRGEVLDGRNRLAACEMAGVEPRFEHYLGDDPFAQVLSLNEARRHLPSGQRAVIVKHIFESRADWQEERNRRANEARRKAAVEQHEVSKPWAGERRDGPVQSCTGPSTPHKSKVEGTRVELAAAAQVSPTTAAKALALPKDMSVHVASGKLSLDDATKIKNMPEEVKAAVIADVDSGVAPKQAIKAHVAHNSGNNEWYTPSEYIEAAREVMGGIDLDPASCELANTTVKATRFYTEEEDGLGQEWPRCRIWLNPPYAAGLIDRFCAKLASSLVESAIVLVNNATETKWTSSIVSVASAVCFPLARIRFLGPDGAKGAPLQGQAIYYIGERVDAFCDTFGRFGWTAVIRRRDV